MSLSLTHYTFLYWRVGTVDRGVHHRKNSHLTKYRSEGAYVVRVLISSHTAFGRLMERADGSEWARGGVQGKAFKENQPGDQCSTMNLRGNQLFGRLFSLTLHSVVNSRSPLCGEGSASVLLKISRVYLNRGEFRNTKVDEDPPHRLLLESQWRWRRQTNRIRI
jgi:hypothetical protein